MVKWNLANTHAKGPRKSVRITLGVRINFVLEHVGRFTEKCPLSVLFTVRYGFPIQHSNDSPSSTLSRAYLHAPEKRKKIMPVLQAIFYLTRF